jgi:hypothetical protein
MLMIFWKYDKQPVFLYEDGFKLSICWKRQESKVNTTFQNPAFNFRVIAKQ